jgi:hypothetical protein
VARTFDGAAGTVVPGSSLTANPVTFVIGVSNEPARTGPELDDVATAPIPTGVPLAGTYHST